MRTKFDLYQFVRATKDCQGLYAKGDIGRVLIPNDEHMEYAWVHFQNGNGMYVFEDAIEAFEITKQQISDYIAELEKRHPAIIKPQLMPSFKSEYSASRYIPIN